MNEFSPASSGDGEEGVVTVRQWLSQPNWVVDRVQSLHIFKQVLDFVDLAHGQGVMLRNIRPSCFLLSPLNKVAFIDSASTRSSSPASSLRNRKSLSVLLMSRSRRSRRRWMMGSAKARGPPQQQPRK